MNRLENVAEVALDRATAPAPAQADLPVQGGLDDAPKDRRVIGPPRSSWYVVASERQLRRARTVDISLLGEPLQVRPGATGPVARSLADGREIPLKVAHGLIWLCLGDVDHAPELPSLIEGVVPIAESAVRARCEFDQAVLGLVDPAHVPMIHQSWWWRPPSKARRVKTKAYDPSPFGFTARAVDAFASAAIYEVVGRQTVEIEFRLPSVRNERILGQRLRLNNLTTITPLDDGEVLIRNLIYADRPWLRILAGPLAVIGAHFLRQDAQILERLEKERRASGPLGLFAGDPDRPSLWYYQLKAAHAASPKAAGFLNPVRSAILKWNT